MGAALVWNPTRAFYKPDGSYDQFSIGDSNPLAMLDYISDGAKTGRFLGNISATLTLIEGLDYKVNFGIDRSNSERCIELSSLLNRTDILGRGYASVNDLSSNNMLIEHTLTYNKAIGHNLSFTGLLGYSYQKLDRSGKQMSGRDFEYNQVSYIDQMQSISQANRSVSSYKNPTTELQSYFGRLNLNMFDKFLITATLRADGSSTSHPLLWLTVFRKKISFLIFSMI
jgi:iron complex outermembrane receptor protein